jgi:hypothetical protein
MTEDDDDRPRYTESTEWDESFGPIDASALREIRDLFVELEPLVETAALDDPLNPQMLSIQLADGIGQVSTARIDIRWSLTGNYAAHYTDDQDRNFRFDCHSKPDAPLRHFHPPPDAPSRPVEQSCITVSEVSLVTRTIRQRWRYALTNETFEDINDAENPP